MIEQIAVRRLAQRDIREAQTWYETVSTALADDFLEAVEHAIDLARQHPVAFPVIFRTFRRVVMQRFPYGVFYYAEGDRLVVVAVLHHSRDPRVLRRRR